MRQSNAATVNLPNANGPIAIAVDPTTHTAYATEGFPFTREPSR